MSDWQPGDIGTLPAPPAPPHVVFATPSLGHSVTLEYFGSALLTIGALQAAGIANSWRQVGGDPFVAKARNRLIAEFLADHADATHLFFIDDDIGWPPEAVLRLVLSGHDVAAGVYPQKLDKPSFAVELDFVNERLTEERGFYLANLVPAGFLCIARGALERLAAASETYEETTAAGRVLTVYDIFRTGVSDGKWWGEDYGFCRRWAALGGTIWADPDIEFSHSGRKRFTGNLMETVQQFTLQQMAKAA